MLSMMQLCYCLLLLIPFTFAHPTEDTTASAPATLDNDFDLSAAWPDLILDTRDIDVADIEYSDIEARQKLATGANCAKGVHVIAAGGDGAWGAAYGNIITMVTNITAAIPGSDSVSLPYPKSSPHGMRATTKGVCTTFLDMLLHRCFTFFVPRSRHSHVGVHSTAISPPANNCQDHTIC